VFPLPELDSAAVVAVRAGTVCVVAGAVGLAAPWAPFGVALGTASCEVFGVVAGGLVADGAGVVAAGVLGVAGAGAVVVGVPGGGAKTAASATLGSARMSTASRDRTAPGLDAWVMEIERIVCGPARA
jgi:hypothetical protein